LLFATALERTTAMNRPGPDMPPFVPGRQLAGYLYREAVAPILERRFPGLAHGAGLLGSGSDALGFDDAQSMDHHWGPRLWLFLDEAAFTDGLGHGVSQLLGDELPFQVHGFPTHFEEFNATTRTVFMAPTRQRPVRHMVFVTTARRFCQAYLRLDPLDRPLSAADWLSTPEQCLRTVTTGAVYHDGTGELARIRHALGWYPTDVWRYVLAAQWRRIAQEEAFVGRTGQVGDELGSRLVAARLVREVMHLGFLLARQYAPYSKWFGSAFSRLACAPELTPSLHAALAAAWWPERERALGTAYSAAAELQNRLRLTPPLPTEVSGFHERPFSVIHADRFVEALEAAIVDPAVRALPPRVGSISQWADATDVLSYPAWYDRLRPLYG
jgi:hypothetical protein